MYSAMILENKCKVGCIEAYDIVICGETIGTCVMANTNDDDDEDNDGGAWW